MSKQKHLTIEERTVIEIELGKRSSFKSIALLIGKDCTTVSKEIRNHRVSEKTGAYGKSFNDCLNAVTHSCSTKHICERCTYHNRPCWACGKCSETCIAYVKYSCPKLNKPPYVCNGCPDRTKCCLEKFFYRAAKSQKEYDFFKSESRSGFAVSEEELKQLDEVISPLIKKGQSLRHISIYLADNGSEFSNPTAVEFDKQGNHRTHMFYCDANAPYQKGNCENNHELIRRIIPKGTDLGQYTQEQINLMMSHINSYARKTLGNKSPYELFAFMYGEELLKVFNLKLIPADEIILTPALLKKM